MIIDFINDLSCVRQDEIYDYQSILSELKQKNNTIFFMPAISWYGGTINLIDKNCGNNGENMIWLVPAGQADFFWLKSDLKKTIEKFYVSDDIKTITVSCFPDIEAEEFKKCILLNSINLQSNSEHLILEANIIFVRLSLSSGRDAYVFILLDHQEQCWKKIVEYYNIALSWFVDSGRGTEDYFIRTNLYKLMQSTSCRDILPMRYFKGLYNMGEMPENFKYRYSMLKLLDVDGYDRWKNFSAVYDINWNGF
ncbi:hypothetical protein B5F08_12415 [Anaeromassilibacillus sp. An172]|uniref:hypothetical protein n=1 Tax=Anaeromassilibacillus sp. An172 TaxID=1965570 RepID=UPI000B3A001E|nr:hypothetical protein [Anaeromassilibacillus sp. An172]OUP74004.1 hypothetical protein B5F08_12415 [Anaeromassilibacillus sp. An172]